MRRFLFGPASAEFADRYLSRGRAVGTVIAFGRDVDLDPRTDASWDEVQSSFPSGWRPDLVVVWLPYTSVPPWVWTAAVPVVGLAPDWNLLWHQFRAQFPDCDAVLTDAPGVSPWLRAGFDHVRPAHLFGLGDEWFREPWADPGDPRDIDIAFVGNFHPDVQGGRLPALGRLARLADRHRVTIHSGVFDGEYRSLLRRSKLVFNRSVRGEANQRAFEAAAAGAVLLQERDNLELRDYMTEGKEFVPYEDDTLAAVVDGLLADDGRRVRIARAARERVRSYRFEELLATALDSLDGDELRARAAERLRRKGGPPVRARIWQHVNSVGPDRDPALAPDLERGGHGHELGVMKHRLNPAEAAPDFHKAAAGNRVSAVALAESIAAAGRRDEAVVVLAETLSDLALRPELSAVERDSVPVPFAYGPFRVAWEKAGWCFPGDPAREGDAKRTLLEWRANRLLGDLTGDPSRYEAALRAWPDDPTTARSLGRAWVRLGRVPDAVPLFRSALAANPFDRATARDLFDALVASGAGVGARRLANDRHVMSRAAPDLNPVETWFANAGPAGDELASIVILCCNEVSVTRACLASILTTTRPPFELILVDNGSTDETLALLADVARWAGPVRVEVITNETNRGFAAGVNQGIARASGDWVVLLNNDTILPPRWLDRLLDVAAADFPHVGLVGPVTNEAPPPQRVAAGYDAPEDLPAFAEDRWRRYRGQTLAFPRLTGFCLAGHRDVFARVGALDEQYGRGFFEDDDLCVRVRRAGYQLRVALGVYLHHHGSRTFAGLGIDTGRQLDENFQRFRDKWGDAEAAPYRKPGGPSRVVDEPLSKERFIPSHSVGTPGHKPRVSLTMIVRDEEDNLGTCLDGLRDLFDEIVVVDTGSKDRTKLIAEAHGARVGDFPWVDDFAAARNAALDLATGDYVFWLDADDRLDDPNRQKLWSLFDTLQDGGPAYVVKCRCVADRAGATATVVDHVRLFPRRPAIRWEHRVHEQILPALRREGVEVKWSDVTVDHVGYVDPEVRGRKLRRDLRILERDLAEKPDHPFTLFNLGSVYQELGDDPTALAYLGRSLARSHPNDSITRKLFALIAQCHRRLGRSGDAAAAVEEGRTHFPADAELLFLAGVLAQESKDWPRAEQAFRELLAGTDRDHFGSVDAGLRGVKARHNLASVFFESGRPDEAEVEWEASLAQDPTFLPALTGLAELAIGRNDGAAWGRIAPILARLDPVTYALWTSRFLMKNERYADARKTLTDALQTSPHHLGLRVLLSHAWLKDGSDPASAEASLLAVLELDPGHRETQNNLRVLRHTVGRP